MKQPTDFYVTFGQKYRARAHERFPVAHPDGWYRLSVMNYEDAKKVAQMLFGAEGYSNVYPGAEFIQSHYPIGELGSWDIRSLM